MSAWGSWPSLDGDDHPRPIRYGASNVIPSLNHQRGGDFGISSIPCYIPWDGKCAHGVLDHDEMDCEDQGEQPGVWPFLRIHAEDDHDAVMVILDHTQVQTLRDQLDEWLTRAVTS